MSAITSKAWVFALATLIAAALVPRALATPVSYSEAIAGDLTFRSAPFMLDVGRNTIAGTTHFDVNSPGRPRFDTDFDSFAFTMPAGLQLAGISLSFATTVFNVSRANLELRLCQGIAECSLDSIELLGSDAVDLLDASPRAIDFAASLPLLAGTYSLITSGIGIGIADVSIPQASWSTDYTWTLLVQNVREPSVVWLLALGLVSWMMVRRLHMPRR